MRSGGIWNATVALACEVISPGDETWEKLDFYASHHVDELVIVDPQEQSVRWLVRAEGAYRQIDRSALIALGPVELADRIDWPSLADHS